MVFSLSSLLFTLSFSADEKGHRCFKADALQSGDDRHIVRESRLLGKRGAFFNGSEVNHMR